MNNYYELATSDAQTTRAQMANKAMRTLIIITMGFAAAIVLVFVWKGAEAAFSIELAGVFAALSGTHTYIVRSYFRDLKNETKSRHRVVDEKSEPVGIAAAILQRKSDTK